MQVSSGTRLGPYELVAPIGAGGMGEVWRATDTRLDRAVAIKLLPTEFADNVQLRSRFEREAKAISQLNHPNICSLFDVGDGYLVMELLEGETLADRIIRGPLSIDQTLKIGAQIADALDRAHRAGIVHRDLKPGNVMLTKTGAKLLDFGLAKSSGIMSGGDPSASTRLRMTEAKPLTAEGTIIGTFQYMAPEQLEGADADPRTDLFALGAVLYEMATGNRAFQATSKTSLIAAIVSAQPPPLSQVVPLTPPAFEHVVQKCLAKDPDARWQSAHDVAEELRWIGEAGSSAGMAAPLVRKRKRMEWLGWAVAAAVLAGAVAVTTLRPTPRGFRIETAIVPPEGAAFSYTAGSIALSRDGRQLAFVARATGGRETLWVRPLASSVARPLAGTEDAQKPFWSPDGSYIAFFAQGKLKKIGVAGGAPETIADAPVFSGGTWLPDGEILFSSFSAIERISAGGGKPVTVTRSANRRLSAPSPLPDGRHFLFTSFRASEHEGVFVGSLDAPEEKLILPNVYSNTVYANPGYIIYSREGDLRAQRFDAKTLKVSGDPIRLADRVQYDADSKAALFDASADGSLVYVEGEGAGKSQLTWISRDGKELGNLGPPAMYYTPNLSHDERRIAYDLSDAETAKGDIWIHSLTHGTSSRLTFDAVNESAPQWMPDDRRVIFFSEKAGNIDLYQRHVGGSGGDEAVLIDPDIKFPVHVSPDGRFLLFIKIHRKSVENLDLWLLDLQKHTSSAWLATPFVEEGAQFSPDGKWIAYSSNESGKSEVYVQQFPEPGGKFVVSRGGGTMPAWRGDGRELYYISADRKMMAAPITIGPQFDSGAPVPLFEARVRLSSASRQYSVTRDGSKFLLNRSVGEEGTKPMTLVQNWMSSIAK